MNRNLKFMGTAAAIMFSYFYYGILQETITRGKYSNDERFTYTVSLVFVQCIVNYLYSLIVLQIAPPTHQGGPQIKQSLYATCALTYVLAMVTSNMSLQWVPYPTQVVGKSCKPIPVMVLGVLIGGRSYSLRKYFFVLAIVVGVGIFMYNPHRVDKNAGNSIGIGEIMLLVSLAMDGLTGAVQERMRGGPVKLNGNLLMKYMNLYSVAFLFVGIIVTGEVVTFPAFLSRHPTVVPHIIGFCLTSALGQFFIYMMVTDFGPLPCSIVTTSRKFFTILISVIVFGNVLTKLQWWGATLVFIGLGLDAVFKG